MNSKRRLVGHPHRDFSFFVKIGHNRFLQHLFPFIPLMHYVNSATGTGLLNNKINANKTNK
jgi:hypothetical protein